MAQTTLELITHAVRITGCAHNGGARGEFIIMGTETQVCNFGDKLILTSQYAKDMERLLNARDMMLTAIGPCPVHGDGCVPHALEWINTMKEFPTDAMWCAAFKRRGHVEQLMLDAANGKRELPTKEELRAWALHLGTPHSKEPT